MTGDPVDFGVCSLGVALGTAAGVFSLGVALLLSSIAFVVGVCMMVGGRMGIAGSFWGVMDFVSMGAKRVGLFSRMVSGLSCRIGDPDKPFKGALPGLLGWSLSSDAGDLLMFMDVGSALRKLRLAGGFDSTSGILASG